MTGPGPGPGWRVGRWPDAPGTPNGRTWLEAATALPDRCWVRPAAARARPPFARVYRTTTAPEHGGPRWYWHCPTCDMGGGHNCLHDLIHPPGTWESAMCGAFHHVHTRHPRPRRSGVALPGWDHTVMFGRRRCDWSHPTDAQLEHATRVLEGGFRRPRNLPAPARAVEIAREVLALAGRRFP